jgi:hypothetical protein
VHCAGAQASSGNFVFRGADGVGSCRAPVEARLVAPAFEKIKGEKRTLDDLRVGESLADVFAKYGAL